MNEMAPGIITGADRVVKPWHRLPATTIVCMSYHWLLKGSRDG